MRLRWRLFSHARRIARRFYAPKRPTILMYHRIACERFDPWVLAVSPTRFELQPQQQAIERLRAQAGVATAPRDSHRLMTREEILASQARGMTMGAHSLSHTALGERSTADQAREIMESRARCAEIIGSAPTC